MNFKTLTLILSGAVAASTVADEVLLNGGKLTPIEAVTVQSSTRHLNFEWAKRFSDGSIHLGHSIGVHAVDEEPCYEYSADNGKTWKKPDAAAISGFNAYENRSGNKCSVGCWSPSAATSHPITVSEYSGEPLTRRTIKSTLILPYSSSVHLHRDCIRLRDGRLLVCGYGRKAGAAKCHNFVLESDDDGKSWKHLAVIAEDTEGKTVEGPDETTILELADGRILAAWRDGGMSPMKQAFSSDGGRSWSQPETIAPFSASPHAIQLKSGTIAIVSGRPDLYLLLDFSGTGKSYQKIRLYKGSTSSYASVIETAPDEIMVIYDESDFGSWRNSSLFNRIVAARYRVVKDASIRLGVDERAAKYSVFYSPASRQLPQQLRIATCAGYRTRAEDELAYLEIVEIPERPHPVLRMVSLRKPDDKHPSNWSLLRSTDYPEDVRRLTIDFEARLMAHDVREEQFYVSGVVGNTGNSKGSVGAVVLALDHIKYLNRGGWKTVKADNSNGFKAYSMRLDSASGTYSLFAPGENSPLFTAGLTAGNSAPAITWGDGSGGFRGAVDLSYIGWKYNDGNTADK